ncbi:hypothetical protein KOR42_29570 [Thalassoglobus neptunius]|uniref:Uncharacterized protein n=1 Tax=Thalassoglobus neptunius TaxID=1938619 RepID=A0A5C5WYI4_9PLAN|nr:hypothetical protein KOR42_29570 [Thalassoglobus neptunius]
MSKKESSKQQPQVNAGRRQFTKEFAVLKTNHRF